MSNTPIDLPAARTSVASERHHVASERLLPAFCADGACDHDGDCESRDCQVCRECTDAIWAEAGDEAPAVMAENCRLVITKQVAPATPTEPRPVRPVYADPGDVEYEYDEDGKPQDPAVRWPIAWGCTVSIGQYDGRLRFTVSISDDVQRDGIAVRSVTRQQIRAYAHHLIELTEVVEDGAP